MLTDQHIQDHSARAVSLWLDRTNAAALDNGALDAAVAQFHQASQDALGDTGGSPLLTIDGHTVFGPVFTAVPSEDEALTLFDAVTVLVRAPQFSQINRPAPTAERAAMCYPVRCRKCGKTTWGGCGLHVESVKRTVPQEQWCGGHPDGQTTRPRGILGLTRRGKKQ
jgi:hypothetical protein